MVDLDTSQDLARFERRADINIGTVKSYRHRPDRHHVRTRKLQGLEIRQRTIFPGDRVRVFE